VGSLFEGAGLVSVRERAFDFASFDRDFERAFGFASFDRDFGSAESSLDIEAVFLARSLKIERGFSVLPIGVAFFAFFPTEPLSDISAGESISRRSLMPRCFSVDGLLESLEEPVHLPCFFEGVGSSF
jgi:hypothetical protein